MATLTAVDQYRTVIRRYPSNVLQSTTLLTALRDLHLDDELYMAFRPNVQTNLETPLDAFIKGPGHTVVELDSQDGARHATVTIIRITI